MSRKSQDWRPTKSQRPIRSKMGVRSLRPVSEGHQPDGLIRVAHEEQGVPFGLSEYTEIHAGASILDRLAYAEEEAAAEAAAYSVDADVRVIRRALRAS